MLWLTWRQHRAELLIAATLLAAVAVLMIVTGVAIHDEFQRDGIAACLADPASRGGCPQLVARFVDRHREASNRLIWVAFLPGLAGVFVGAPLLAREFEHGTWRLAFTQTVTRTRWLTAKLAIVGGGAVMAAAAFAALFTWWRAPFDAIEGRLRTPAFVVAAPSLCAVTLFAFAAGVFAGALLRRTIAAMGVTLAAFLAVRIPMEEYGRPHYRAPLVRITDPVTQPATTGPRSTDWTVATGWVDRSGHVLSAGEEADIVHRVYSDGHTLYGDGTPIERYLAEHGLRHYTEYQPGGRFWTLQAIESAWFVGFAALLLVASVWLVRRRTT
jgi:hypothetical protein